MIVDAVLLMYGQLTDVTSGLNAQLAAVPRDTADAAPPTCTYAHAFQSAVRALGGLERDDITSTPRVDVLPAPTDVVTSALQGNRGVSVDVVVRYAVRGIAFHTLKKDALQTLRTAIRVLSAPWNDATFTDITRNDVLFDPPDFRLAPEPEEVGDDYILHTLLVTLRTVDKWQLGLT